MRALGGSNDMTTALPEQFSSSRLRWMTVRLSPCAPNRESFNAELCKNALLASKPDLAHPDIRMEILYGLYLPDRQIDIVILYHDPRPQHLQLRTSGGYPIHSFVAVLEAKGHPSPLIRFNGTQCEVRYKRSWHDATDQCDAQMHALRNYQAATYKGSARRAAVWTQRAIWLTRAQRSEFNSIPARSSVPVHFADLKWDDLVENFSVYQGSVRALQDHASNYRHSFETLRELLAHEVRPTRLDIKRLNALAQTRFDAEKTAYIRNLGSGLLLLRGRGGTGKTFALLQVAIHLAKQGKRAVLLTYNHGLLADINRLLRFLAAREDEGFVAPKCQTRYSFIQDVFEGEFGSAAERAVIKDFALSAREEVRLSRLLDAPGNLEIDFDFVLIDEGQDWSEAQRDFIYKAFDPKNVIVADGVDQFVDRSRCRWDLDDIPINRRHGLRASRRTKGATCQTIAEVAREFNLADWDLEPDPDAYGGRFTVIVEPDAERAVSQGLELIEMDQTEEATLRAVDNLICLPSEKMSGGVDYPRLFDQAIGRDFKDSWRGFEERDRRVYPMRDGQLRAVQYQSCRGMEGWTTLCVGLDQFFGYQLRNPQIDEEELQSRLQKKHGMFLDRQLVNTARDTEARTFAINWLMIPLTRSIDHLIVHIFDLRSELGQALQQVSDRSPGSIEWIGSGAP